VSGLDGGIRAVSVGEFHYCALTEAGAVLCWGDNDEWQLGDGSHGDYETVPVPVAGLDAGVKAIATGLAMSCAITEAGALMCWGSNFWGEFVFGDVVGSPVPFQVPGFESGTVAVSLGWMHGCAINAEHRALCWGGNNEGAVGNGTKGESTVGPTEVVGLETEVVSIAAGQQHTCAVTTGGDTMCWGRYGWGNLADGTAAESLVPRKVEGLPPNAVSVSVGQGGHTCVETLHDGIWCWGANGAGQLGNGAFASSSVPTRVAGYWDPW